MKIAIVAIAKNEERYIEEWLNYYRRLGATHFFIYDNNDEGNDNLIKLIGSNPDVTLIDVRGRAALKQFGMQQGCYQHAYNQQKNNFDYFGYFDIDEFLYMNEKTIPEFVSQEQFKDADVIKFNWRYYGDNDLVYYDPRPVQERFIKPCPDDVRYNLKEPAENRFCKCLVKSGKRLLKNNLHYFTFENGICKHASGKPGNDCSKYEPIDFSNGYVKHYGTKTIEEYVRRRCRVSCTATTEFFTSAKVRLQWFFNVNKHTPEKDAIADWVLKRGK